MKPMIIIYTGGKKVRSKLRKSISKGLIGIMLIGTGLSMANVPASTVHAEKEKTKEEIEKEKEEIEQEKKEKEAELSQLNSAKKKILDEIEVLDGKIVDSEDKIRELTNERNKLESEISVIDLKLQNAYVAENNQYAEMKERIRFAYENNDVEYIDALLAVTDFDNINNAAEYVSKISAYDQAQLNSLIKIEAEISEYQETLEQNLTSINTLKSDAETEKANLVENETAKQAKVKEFNGEISETQIDIAELAELERQADAELERLAAAAPKVVTVTETVTETITVEVPVTKTVTKPSNTASSTDATKTTTQTTTEVQTQTVTKQVQVASFSGGFIWPCPSSHRITSTFGGRASPGGIGSTNHKGIDIGAGSGSSVVAAAGGAVYFVGYNRARGNYVMVNHGGGFVTVYQHLSGFNCSVGQAVSQGDCIGFVGSTGYSTGPHLHFEVVINGTPVNPLGYVH